MRTFVIIASLVIFGTGLMATAQAAADRSCADLFDATTKPVTTFQTLSRPRASTPTGTSVTAIGVVPLLKMLSEIPELANKANVDFRRPLSPAAVAYIRRATGVAALTEAQTEELYNNNLRLLALRAQSKLESILVEQLLATTSRETIVADISARYPVLLKYLTPNFIFDALETAIHNSNFQSFPPIETIAIVELQALAKLTAQDVDAVTLKAMTTDTQSRLRPAIAHRMQVEKNPGCCKTSVCNTCPNSLRLKQEVKRQTGDTFNVHLKKIAGEEPPAELKLFNFQDLLRTQFPDVNW